MGHSLLLKRLTFAAQHMSGSDVHVLVPFGRLPLQGSKAVISRGLARARKELWPLGAAAAAPAAAGSGFMAGCYAAAAANARAAGARSGLMGQAVFSCTARGRVGGCGLKLQRRILVVQTYQALGS